MTGARHEVGSQDEYDDMTGAQAAFRAEQITTRLDRFLATRPPVFAGDWPLHEDAETWADDLAAGTLEEQNLWLAGGLGTGKTWTAYKVIERALRNGWPGGHIAFIRGSEFQQMAAPPVDYPAIDRLAMAAVLVLDDLGSGRLSAWDQDRLEPVLNARWMWQLPTIITTNAGNLGDMVGERAADRLAGGGIVPVAFTGPSHRRDSQ